MLKAQPRRREWECEQAAKTEIELIINKKIEEKEIEEKKGSGSLFKPIETGYWHPKRAHPVNCSHRYVL